MNNEGTHSCGPFCERVPCLKRRVEELEAEKADRIETFEEWKAGIDTASQLADSILVTSLETKLEHAEAKIQRVRKTIEFCEAKYNPDTGETYYWLDWAAKQFRKALENSE